MAKGFIEDATLTAIAEAIREKTGTTTTYKPSEMAPAIQGISGGGGGEPEIPVITGDCYDRFASNGWNWVIEQYPNKLVTQNITNCTRMFVSSDKLEEIPFTLNCGDIYSLENLFAFCSKLKTLPHIVIKSISPYGGSGSQQFRECHSIKEIPSGYLDAPVSDLAFRFYFCSVLNKIENMVISTSKEFTYNKCNSAFNYCGRLSKLTFKPSQTVKWTKQIIDLTQNVGYVSEARFIKSSNSGITTATQVTDDASYQALKNNPDWWTLLVQYSRYNHDSAVETINSLPDTTDYLAQKGGTNTIKFKGAAGSATDGGAINTLTDAEIAVATSKGWTVTLV